MASGSGNDVTNPFAETNVQMSDVTNSDLTPLQSFMDIAVRQRGKEDSTNKAANQITTTMLPRRSISAADIYSEIKETTERELVQMINEQKQTINEQKQTITELGNQVKALQNVLDDRNRDDEETARITKKRKLDEIGNNNEEEEISKKVDDLEKRLAEREAELEETREVLAESEYKCPSSDTTPGDEFLSKVSTLIENKMRRIEMKFEAMEKKIEERSMGDAKKVTLSFSDAVSKNLDKNIFNTAIQESKNTERIIESERNSREKNIIIYGVAEVGNSENGINVDGDYMKSFFNYLA